MTCILHVGRLQTFFEGLGLVISRHRTLLSGVLHPPKLGTTTDDPVPHSLVSVMSKVGTWAYSFVGV